MHRKAKWKLARLVIEPLQPHEPELPPISFFDDEDFRHFRTVDNPQDYKPKRFNPVTNVCAKIAWKRYIRQHVANLKMELKQWELL